MLSLSQTREDNNKYIYCVINTNNQRKTYFLNEDDTYFTFDIIYLKVELVRVASESEEYKIAVENSLKCIGGFRIK